MSLTHRRGNVNVTVETTKITARHEAGRPRPECWGHHIDQQCTLTREDVVKKADAAKGVAVTMTQLWVLL